MIWTDICPIFIYFYLLFFHLHSNYYLYLSDFRKCLLLSFYSCAFISKFFSAIYHIFNVVSIEIHELLLKIDYIGISSVVLTYPYIYANIFDINDFSDFYFQLFLLFLIIIEGFFIANPTLFNLIFISFIANILTTLIILNNQISLIWKISYGTSSLFMYGGIIIYHLNIPECLWLNKYTKTYFYSHIIWHNCVTVAELLLINASFYPCKG